MKKIVCSVIAVGFVLITANVYAASIGGSWDIVEQGKFGISMVGDYISEKEFDVPSYSGPGTALTELKFKNCRDFGVKLSYGVLENLNIYLKGGFSEKEIKTTWADASKTDLEVNNGTFFGIGGKYAYWFDQDYLVAIDAQYIQHPDKSVDTVRENGITASAITSAGDIKYYEFKAAFIFGKNFELSPDLNLLPYLGLSYDKFNLRTDTINYSVSGNGYTLSPMDLDEEKNLGFILGSDLKISENVKFNVEGRFSSETAFSGNIILMF
ncbi:MAG: autotransporter outer membrane beta-barrel domain-containing protein [Candidatus Omnitrophota bacterium]